MKPLRISHPQIKPLRRTYGNIQDVTTTHLSTDPNPGVHRQQRYVPPPSSCYLSQKGFCAAEPKEEQLLIYINLKKAMDAGMKFYASSAGLVTPGDEAGFLRPRFFQYVYVRVIQRKTLLGRPSQPWLVTPKRPLSTTRLRLGLNPRRRWAIPSIGTLNEPLISSLFS